MSRTREEQRIHMMEWRAKYPEHNRANRLRDQAKRPYIPHPRPRKTAEEIRERQRLYYASRYVSHPKKIFSAEELRDRKNARARLKQAKRRADPIIGPAIKAADRARLEKWRLANPEKVKQMKKMVSLRRSKKITGKVSLSYWLAIVSAFGGVCAVCGKPDKNMHRDHWYPVALGGKHANGNIIPLCGKCNVSKGAKQPHQWLIMQEHGLYNLARIETTRRRLHG